MLHVRFEGRSFDFNEDLVGKAMSDGEIRNLVAQRLEVNAQRLAPYVIDRRPTGDVIVRPEAVYG